MAEEIKWGNSWIMNETSKHLLPISIIVKAASDMLALSQNETVIHHYITDEIPVVYDHCELVLMSDTQLTFQCDCGAIHDPETNSFTKLMESARSAEWSIKFRDIGYNVKCRECK